jgi:hypothetical protein
MVEGGDQMPGLWVADREPRRVFPSTAMTRLPSMVVVRVQAYRHSCASRAASRRAKSVRRFDSPGAARSPNPAREWLVRAWAQSPIAVKLRHPARVAEIARRSRPVRGYLLPLGLRGSGTRAR